MASSATSSHHHHVVHLGLGRARWQGAQGLLPTTSTASLPVLARRFLADPHEIGRFEGIGPDLWKPVSSSTMTSTSRAAPVRSLTRASTSRAAGEIVDQGQRRPRAGHCRRLWERLWERRRELGANTYRVLVPPKIHRGGLDWFGTRADPRGRGPPCAGGHGRLAEAGVCRSS